jgi:DNA-directed RNA polymerase specialized sigma24 family protein
LAFCGAAAAVPDALSRASGVGVDRRSALPCPPTRPGQWDWELRHDLARALAQISPKHRAVLLDHYVYGFRGAEPAERHEYAEESVSNVRTRALGRLLKILVDHDWEDHRSVNPSTTQDYDRFRSPIPTPQPK